MQSQLTVILLIVMILLVSINYQKLIHFILTNITFFKRISFFRTSKIQTSILLIETLLGKIRII